MGTASTLAINPAAFGSLPYDVLTDLAPIGAIADVPNIMVINPAMPCEDMEAFIAYAKLGPRHMTYGSSGNGSVSHLMGEQFKLATHTHLVHVPYRGVGPALGDAVSGQIKVMFDNLPTSLALVQAGKLRALAVSSPQRLAVLPDVPTFAELKLDDLDWTAFFGLVAPARTPQAVIATLNAALNDALNDPSVRARLAAQQATVTPGKPEAFGALIRREGARMRRATQAANIRID
jgi:tripartite-type tricarboxylate transporter receptor subunit TctC